METFLKKKKLVTSLLIERQENSQNLGSIPIALQKLCKKKTGSWYKPGANRINAFVYDSFSFFFLTSYYTNTLVSC